MLGTADGRKGGRLGEGCGETRCEISRCDLPYHEHEVSEGDQDGEQKLGGGAPLQQPEASDEDELAQHLTHMCGDRGRV